MAQAENILMSLTRERAEYFSGLREYVRWLIEKKNRNGALSKFEQGLIHLDESLEEKLVAGELSETQANQRRGDSIWWKAMEETQGAASNIAARLTRRKYFPSSFTAFLEGESPEDGKTPAEIQEEINSLGFEIEGEMPVKLRQCLNQAEV